MKVRTSPWHLLFVTLISFNLLVPNAKAASILIDAGNIEELVTFTFSQFEGGFSINGSTPTSGGSFTFGEGTQLNFTGQWIDLGQATSSTRTVYWIEPQSTTVISEILQWTITPSGASGLATISGFFQAEGLGTIPPGVPQADLICEQFDGSHDPFQFSAAFFTGQIITGPGDQPPPGEAADCSGPIAQVPEPGALLLLTAGLFALGFIRRR